MEQPERAENGTIKRAATVRIGIVNWVNWQISLRYCRMEGPFKSLDCDIRVNKGEKAKSMSTKVGPNVGQLAPEIDLLDGDGKRWKLSEARGRAVVLVFYPGDETPVCTKQLCSIRDNWARYRQTGAEVIGINTDSVEKHQSFAANHNLPLRLLSDEESTVVRAYDMKSPLWIKRGIVVIDKDGYIRYRKVVFPAFRPSDDEVIAAIKNVLSPDGG